MDLTGWFGGFIDGVPLVGHAKGAVHYIVGDKEGGDNAMKSASRTTGKMIGGAVGMALGGPVGAMAGGVYGGLLTDCITSAVDSVIHNERRLSGLIKLVDEPDKNLSSGEQLLGIVCTIAGDAATGYAAGNVALNREMHNNFQASKNNLVSKVGKDAAKDLIHCGSVLDSTMKEFNVPEKTPIVTSTVHDLDTGDCFTGHNKQVRDIMGDTGTTASPSHLEKRFPDACPPLKRSPRSCAEQQAYDKFYDKNPEGDPKQTRVSSVRCDKKTGEKRAVRRCANCKAYMQGMGEAPADLINDVVVPTIPGSSTLEAVLKATLCAACLSIFDGLSISEGTAIAGPTQSHETLISYEMLEELEINEDRSFMAYRRHEVLTVG